MFVGLLHHNTIYVLLRRDSPLRRQKSVSTTGNIKVVDNQLRSHRREISQKSIRISWNCESFYTMKPLKEKISNWDPGLCKGQ